jgi:hypothetical protein
MSRRSDREGYARDKLCTPITLRYAHAYQLDTVRLTARCGQVAYAKSRLRHLRGTRLNGRGRDIDPQGGFHPLP